MFEKKTVPLTKVVPFAKTAVFHNFPQKRLKTVPLFSSTLELFWKTATLFLQPFFSLIIMFEKKTVPLTKVVLKRYLNGGHHVDMKTSPPWSHFGSTFIFQCAWCESTEKSSMSLVKWFKRCLTLHEQISFIIYTL